MKKSPYLAVYAATKRIFVQVNKLSKLRSSRHKNHPQTYKLRKITSEAQQDRCRASEHASKNQTHRNRGRNLLSRLCN
jgi:hypothetical protein